MTVGYQGTRVSYPYGGAVTQYPVPFRFLAGDDIKVLKTLASGETVRLARGTDYSVAGIGDQAGGQVALGTPLVAGEAVTIARETARDQQTIYVPNDPFPAKSHERALDKLTLIAQEQDAESGRAIKAPFDELDAGELDLPPRVQRARKLLGFDVNGLPVASGVTIDMIEQAIRAAFAPEYTQYAGNVLFIADDPDADSRPMLDKARETISVADRGATGNGVTDDTAAIRKADRLAARKGKRLFLPAGKYSIRAIEATTSWIGEDGTELIYRGNDATFVPMVEAVNVDYITFDTITFDGNVSADPVQWNAANYDAFTGAAGLSIIGGKSPRVINCRARNTRQHGFRYVNVTGGVWRDCETKKSRGNFGDGFLAISCMNLKVTDCYAEDYTRIGFVVDSFGDNIITCQKIAFSRCFATNGHHASYLYGGAEFNAGYWFEHTGDATLSQCFAFNNTHRGINACTGSRVAFPGRHAAITVDNCHTIGGEWGILTYSLGDLPVVSKVSNCTAKLAGTAFEGQANVAGDVFYWGGIHADYDAASSARWGVSCQVSAAAGAAPVFTIGEGCTFSRWRQDMTKLLDNGDNAATADIGGYFNPAAPLRLSIRGARAVDDGPIYVRWYEKAGVPHDFFATDVDLYVSRGASHGGRIRAHEATIRSMYAMYGEANLCELKNNTYYGDTHVSAIRHDLVGVSALFAGAEYIWLVSSRGNRFPAVTVTGARFEKDITKGYALRLGLGQASFTAIINSALFFNSGAGDGGNACVGYATDVKTVFTGTTIDATIENITMLDSGGGFENVKPGATKVTLH